VNFLSIFEKRKVRIRPNRITDPDPGGHLWLHRIRRIHTRNSPTCDDHLVVRREAAVRLVESAEQSVRHVHVPLEASYVPQLHRRIVRSEAK
jgi:hypothetical protein